MSGLPQAGGRSAAGGGDESFDARKERVRDVAGRRFRHRLCTAEVGEKVYAEFGDDVAKPRMNVELQRVADNVTGSHLGNVGALSVSKSFDEFKQDSDHNIIGYSGSETDGAIFFADKYWKPELYWKWRDEQWNEGAGHVEVLPIQPAPSSSPPEHFRR